ncbi:MAG TPA: hypothetical protein VGD46_24995, partial [Rhizobacter sp.]
TMATTERRYYVALAREYHRRAQRKAALVREGLGTALDPHNVTIFRIARDRCLRHARRQA